MHRLYSFYVQAMHRLLPVRQPDSLFTASGASGIRYFDSNQTFDSYGIRKRYEKDIVRYDVEPEGREEPEPSGDVSGGQRVTSTLTNCQLRDMNAEVYVGSVGCRLQSLVSSLLCTKRCTRFVHPTQSLCSLCLLQSLCTLLAFKALQVPCSKAFQSLSS